MLSRMTVRVGDALASQLSQSPGFFKAWVCGWIARKLCLLDDGQQRAALQGVGELFMQEWRFGVQRGDTSIAPASAEFVKFNGAVLTAGGRVVLGQAPLLIVHAGSATPGLLNYHRVEAFGAFFDCYDLSGKLWGADGKVHTSQCQLLYLAMADLVHLGATPFRNDDLALTAEVVRARGTNSSRLSSNSAQMRIVYLDPHGPPCLCSRPSFARIRRNPDLQRPRCAGCFVVRARSPRFVEVLAAFVVEGLIHRDRQSRPFVSGQRLRYGRPAVRRRRRRRLGVVERSHKQSRNAYRSSHALPVR